MIKIVSVVALLLLMTGVFMAWQAWLSRSRSPAPALVNDKLRPCLNKPNCLSTETLALPPIDYRPQSADEAWQRLQQVIAAHKGQFRIVRDDYLWAEFDSSVFAFRDDVEARLDRQNRLIHLRSGSRVGYYDFGANRKRLQALIAAMAGE